MLYRRERIRAVQSELLPVQLDHCAAAVPEVAAHRQLPAQDTPAQAALRLRRRANYEALHAALAPHNALDCPSGADAMIYPFLCRVDGLRGRLIKNKVYGSQWWKYLLELLPADSMLREFYGSRT